MKVIRSKDFHASRAWGAELVAAIPDATVRLHRTDQPYPWHVNDGEEVLVVLDGTVDMHYRTPDAEGMATLASGDIFFAAEGEAHSAHPRGPARVLVIEHPYSD